MSIKIDSQQNNNQAEGSIVIGKGAKAEPVVTSDSSDSSKSGALNAVVIGNNAEAKATSNIAIGDETKADGEYTVVIGRGAKAEDKNSNNSIVIGKGAKTSNQGTIALGLESESKGELSIAIGSRVGSENYTTIAEGTHSIAFGVGAKTGNKAANSIAFGVSTNAQGVNSTALGTNAYANGAQATSLGSHSMAYGNNTIAIGTSSKSTGSSSNVIGFQSTASGQNLSILGANNTISASVESIDLNIEPVPYSPSWINNSSILGNNNVITTNNTFVLGSNVNSKMDQGKYIKLEDTVENSVYLGNESIATAGKTENTKHKKKQGNNLVESTTTTAGDKGTVSKATVRNITYGEGTTSSFAGNTANGVVTVGASGGKERRIQNVAAGEISQTSTDAINGSQLYAVTDVIGNLAASTASHLGGGATVRSNGSIAQPTYSIYKGNTSPATSGNSGDKYIVPNSTTASGTGSNSTSGDYKNVGEAFTALNRYINEGFEILDNTGNKQGVVTPGNKIKFADGKNTTAKVTQENNGTTTITFDVDIPEQKNIDTTTLTVKGDGVASPTKGNGVVEVPQDNGDKFVTAKTVADAINKSHFVVDVADASSETFDEDTTTSFSAAVKTGDELKLKSGKNIKMKADGAGGITVATKDNVEFTTITVPGAKSSGSGDVSTSKSITINTRGIDMGDKPIINLKSVIHTAYPEANKNEVKLPKSVQFDTVKNNAATVGDVLNAGWNLEVNNEAKDFVKPFDTVNFVGEGVTITHENKDGKNVVKFNVEIPELPKVETAKLKVGENGKVTDLPEEAKKLATAGDIAKAINESGFTLKTSATTDGEKDKTSTPENGELINPGDSVEMIAGKNLTVKQENGKVTYATKDKVDFDEITLSNEDKNKVKLVNGAPVATDANVNPTESKPTASLNITSADKKPTQLTGVGSALNSMQIETNTGIQPQGSAQKGTDTLLNLTGAQDKPLDNSVLNSAATVRDLIHLGWVVSASGNEYKNTVKNANEVNFVGANGISVTGETKENVREIKISVDAQSAVESAQLPVVYTNKAGDKLVKVNGKFYKAEDVTNGKPKDDATLVETKDVIASMNNGDNNTRAPIALSNLKGNLAPTYNAGDKKENENKKLGDDVVSTGDITKSQTAPTNVADIYHNAATVGDLLNAGWNLQVNGEGKDFVKAYDAVNFANGVGTTVNVEVAEDGKTSAIRINSLLGITDKAGNQLVKGKDGKYYKPSALKPNGEPKDNAVGGGVEAGDVQVNVINPAAADATKGNAVQVGNLSSGLSTQEVATKPNGTAGTDKLLNLTNNNNAIPDSNAATVGDLRNMGWVVSASGNGYIDTVKNANKVDFVGSGLATVTGETQGDVRTITVNVDAQAVTNNARLPVVYTDKNGTQIYPIKDKDGNITYNTKPDGQGETVEPDNVITSINGSKGTTTPTVLTNVMSNLPATYNDDVYNLNKKTVTKTQDLPLELKVNNAATVSDILNAGWNLKNNGQPGDFVKAYDSVDFIDGKGMTAVVKTTKDGTSTTVKYDAKIDNNTIKLNDKGELYADYAGDIAKATTKVAAGNNIEVTPKVNPDGSTTYTVATKDDVAFETVKVGDNVNINHDGLTIKDGPSITVAGIDGGNKKITGVADGDISPTSHDAINGSQLYAVQQALTGSIAASKEEVTSTDNSVTVTATPNDSGANVFDLSVNTDNTTITKDATTGALKAKTTVLSNTNGKVDTPAPENANALVSAQDIASAINRSGFTLKAQGENGSTIHPGATVDMKNTDSNIVISKSAGSNDVTYNLARDIKVDQVRAGNTVLNSKGVTIGSGANQVELTENGLNNGGNRITNVAPGQAPTDAVNVSQLRGQMGNVYHQMNKMGKDLRGGIAGSNAAATLPQVYMPGKSMVAASAGTFKGENAFAVGYSRVSDNGKLILKLQGNANSRGNVGGGVGIGYQW
ncbi:autotransporter adhesin [Actinobacillus seminis]|nr:YadA-like family protein [Actinobacillus seminis]SUU34627.1 autotransporter adhesin [Actinobacillus seminis]